MTTSPLNTAREALERARAAMDSATVFVTSRQRIKQPEGDEWWLDEIKAVDVALSAAESPPPASPIQAHGESWKALGSALVAHAGGHYSWPPVGGLHAHNDEYMSLHGNEWHLPSIFAALATLNATPPAQTSTASEQAGEAVRKALERARDYITAQNPIAADEAILQALAALSRGEAKEIGLNANTGNGFRAKSAPEEIAHPSEIDQAAWLLISAARDEWDDVRGHDVAEGNWAREYAPKLLALYPTPPALKASELGSEELRERLIAILDPIAYSLPDFRQGNVNNGADQILALFSAVPQSTISEGWRLVPTKHNGRAGLTHDMCEAFWLAHDVASAKGRGHYEATNAGYNAMLATAPLPAPPAPAKETVEPAPRDTTQLPARVLTDAELIAEQTRVEKLWDGMHDDLIESGGRGGSPGEWMVERMDEIATEQQRRK